jgi:cysteine desulfurase/selenocysteine lyase
MHPAVANGTYDVDRIRRDFPILAVPVYGKPLVYLDNAASAQKPRDVLDRMYKGYTHEYANVHRGLHFLANAATEAYEGARDKVRASSMRAAGEIIFTRNATEAINLVASTFGRDRIKPGDEIVLSIMEHHSNIVPWHFLRERHGAVIKWAPVDDDGNFLLDEFEKLLGRAPRWWRSPRCRTRSAPRPGEGGRAARACARHSGAGRRQPGAVHLDVDVQDIGCDFYVFTGHKLYGRPASARSTANTSISRDAAVQRRRRDDPRGVRGPHHLRRSAAQIRGRHAGHRAGHRARRRHRLRQFHRQGAHARA